MMPDIRFASLFFLFFELFCILHIKFFILFDKWYNIGTKYGGNNL